jgi:hypothetical protein
MWSSAERLSPTFIYSIINSNGSSRKNKEEKPLDSAYISYVKGVSQKYEG